MKVQHRRETTSTDTYWADIELAKGGYWRGNRRVEIVLYHDDDKLQTVSMDVRERWQGEEGQAYVPSRHGSSVFGVVEFKNLMKLLSHLPDDVKAKIGLSNG